MKITTNWLKEHLDTKFSEIQIINKLTEIGLEVENIKSSNVNLDNFIVCKIVLLILTSYVSPFVLCLDHIGRVFL